MNEFAYPEGKTIYPILNEYGEKTTITLDKWIADILQLVLDVHNWLQLIYDKAQQSKPDIGRMQLGNYVRRMAEVAANKHQEIKKETLGWNDQDMYESI